MIYLCLQNLHVFVNENFRKFTSSKIRKKEIKFRFISLSRARNFKLAQTVKWNGYRRAPPMAHSIVQLVSVFCCANFKGRGFDSRPRYFGTTFS